MGGGSTRGRQWHGRKVETETGSNGQHGFGRASSSLTVQVGSHPSSTTLSAQKVLQSQVEARTTACATSRGRCHVSRAPLARLGPLQLVHRFVAVRLVRRRSVDRPYSRTSGRCAPRDAPDRPMHIHTSARGGLAVGQRWAAGAHLQLNLPSCGSRGSRAGGGACTGCSARKPGSRMKESKMAANPPSLVP